jgi:putative ABC transport system permease protein
LHDVARLVIVQGMKPTLAGIGIGVIAALGLGRIVSSMIYGVSSCDLLTFLAVTMLLILVSFGASLL